MPNEPRILYLDIESSDLSADIGNLLTIGYMWEGEQKPTILTIAQYPGKRINDDSRLLEAFRPIYESADLIVHHFGDLFDVPFIQTRALIHNLKPFPHVASVDTWRIARKKLKFGSNRLARILEVLGCPYEKSPVKLSVWAEARCGDRSALKYIAEHNRLDVLVLQWVYKRLRPVWNQHPALVFSANLSCPVCGSRTKSKGRQLCATYSYQRRICLGCGKSFKGPRINLNEGS